MIIHLLAPFFGGSHRRWAEEYARHSRHTVRLFTLPGRHWKWRMHGAAVHLAGEWLAQPETPDLILTTDMLDAATFAALTRGRAAEIPLAVYFHENQLTYPWSPTDADPAQQRDRHYAWINYTTALTADAALFNSDYHRASFLSALPAFLRAFPDYRGMDTLAAIERKARTLYLGMELPDPPETDPAPDGPPVLLWNHRWEYDKHPEAFFRVCARLRAETVPFRLIVLGEQYARSPTVFTHARAEFQDHILHWGYAAGRAEYLQWLRRADVLPVTSGQDFFGGSVVEAIHQGVYPLLPDRLAYPEHLPADRRADHLYAEEEELFQKLRALLRAPRIETPPALREHVERYAWARMGERYDGVLAGGAGGDPDG